MYNIEKMITSGKETIRKNPRRDISSAELYSLVTGTKDRFEMAGRAFLLGVAVGMRTAKAQK